MSETIRIVPTRLDFTSTAYHSETNVDNAFTNTDSETYATITGTVSSKSNVGCYLRGFDLSLVPSFATVTNVSAKVKVSTTIADGDYKTVRLRTTYSDSARLSIYPTPTILTFNDTWEHVSSGASLIGYPSLLFDLDLTSYTYVYIYGAEIEVTYDLPPKIFNLILPRG